MITTMYPDPLRPGTEVCHYYSKEWAKMGYDVLVINLRSMFPAIYTIIASLMPGLAHRYIGNHVEMDRNMNIINHVVDNIPVYSVPVFKYIPHRKYPKHSINKLISTIINILNERNFLPDAIVGHFYNPTMEIIYRLKYYFPNSRTSIVFHESKPKVIIKNYSKDLNGILKSFNIVGFRNKGMQERMERYVGVFNKSFICYSGTHPVYLNTPRYFDRVYTNKPLSKFMYVGQFTENKCVKETIKALHSVYSDNYVLTCIGDGGPCLKEIKSYIMSNEIQNHVLFTGHIPRENIIRYYDENECLIMISKSEAFGLVYLEAMSRGCIVIGTRGQGIDGVIIDGVNGFLCSGGNVEELASVIGHINSLSSEEKMRISDNAINTARDFSDYNVAKNYIAAVFNS